MRKLWWWMVASLMAASAAQAQVAMGSIGMWNTNYMLNRQIMDMANKPLFDKGALDPRKAATVAAAPPLSATAYSPDAGSAAGVQAAKIAQAYPAANRAEAEGVFRKLLAGYHDIERQFGIAQNDVAGAVAAFVAGSYMAYRDTPFPDENFKPLVAQMRRIVSTNDAFQRASNTEKQAMYEQMAILGMFMATTQMALEQKPNPQVASNMRTAAKEYLETFLKTDADRVQITRQGLVIR